MGKTKIVNGAVVTEIDVDPKKTNEQLERESHAYSLRRVKTFRGREGSGLNAELLRDGKVVAFITDEGNGGMMWFDWTDRMHGKSAEEDLFKAFVPPDPDDKDDEAQGKLSPETIKAFAMEQWVNKTVDDLLNAKRFKRMCKTKTLFQVGANVGSEEFFVIKGPYLPHVKEHLERKYAGQKLRIINEEFKD